MALIAPVDTRVVKMTLVIALPTAPIIIEEGRCAAEPIMFVVPRELVIMEVAREKKLVMMDLLVIKVAMEVLPIIAETLSSEVIGDVVPTVASLLAV